MIFICVAAECLDVGTKSLIAEAFAEAHDLAPGDAVRAIINGKRDVLRIVGIALSPEYVLQMRAGDPFPDPKRFGVFWMPGKELAAAYDMDGAFNSVTLSLQRGAFEQYVIERLDALTEPYGGIGAYGRADQISHRFLTDEIAGLRHGAYRSGHLPGRCSIPAERGHVAPDQHAT